MASEVNARRPSLACVIMVKDPQTATFRISLKSVCRADCVDEVLVVTPHPDKLAWVREACPKARLVKDPGWGIGIARNYGIANSRSDVVAFVDPDAVVAKTHFCEILKAFEDPQVGVVDVESAFDEERLSRCFTKVQLLENLVWKRGRVARLGDECAYAGGTFMAVRRSVWEEVGGFWKYPPYGSDDMDFSYRVRKAGYRIKRIRVRGSFHIPRATLRELFREQYGWGRGFAVLMLKYLRDEGFWRSYQYHKLLYKIVPRDYLFLIPVLRAMAAPLSGLANSIRWRDPRILPYWTFRRYSFLLGFISGLYSYMRLKSFSRKEASLSARAPHS